MHAAKRPHEELRVFSIPSNIAKTSKAVAAVVATLAFAGCAADRSASPTPVASTSKAVVSPQEGIKGTPLYVPPGKTRMTGFNPFWFEASAEQNWAARRGQPQDPTLAPAPRPEGDRSEAAPIEMPVATNEAPMGDALDGLIHVTYAAQGADFDPCISRDGSKLVFASTQHRETADIYVKNVNGRTVTQLTADPAHDVMPTISPDGQRIAFASNRAGNWDIFVMSSGGGQAVQLTSDFAHELHPSWSPDGTKIVFCRLGEISGRWELWVMDANGSSSTEFVGYGMFPDWCPVPGTGFGGRDKILFQRSRERGDRAFSIWTVDYQPGDTSSPTEIASSRDAALINASWSPDGSRIVFATLNHRDLDADPTPSGTPASDLWIVGVDGTGRVSLTGGRFMNLMPTWGPDQRIYFVSDRTGVSNIWSVGTEKAIVAATGKPMSLGKQTEITNVPTNSTTPATAP